MMPDRIYLDTAPVIYAVEQVASYAIVVDAHLARPDIVVVASDLTRLECRVKPIRENDQLLLADYDQFFNEIVGHVVALSTDVMDRATEIRARYGFKTPDAIHLAAAVLSKCDTFLTNDDTLTRFPDIAVVTVRAAHDNE